MSDIEYTVAELAVDLERYFDTKDDNEDLKDEIDELKSKRRKSNKVFLLKETQEDLEKIRAAILMNWEIIKLHIETKEAIKKISHNIADISLIIKIKKDIAEVIGEDR